MSRLARLDAVGDTPMDRHTRICEALSKTFEDHPETADDDRLIVLIGNRDNGGAVVVGYDEEADVLTDMLTQTQVIAEAMGRKLDLNVITDDGVTTFEGGGRYEPG